MAGITASLVKELRDRTGAGMMECKKALTEANGDIELAIENMRKHGLAKAAKKAARIAAEGVVLTRVNAAANVGYVVELNCETDFVAKDAGFLGLANKCADFALENDADTDAVKAKFEDERAALVAKIGENITIRRVVKIEGTFIGGYSHGSKIAVLVALSAKDEDTAKKIGMHVASSRPEYVKADEIPAEVVEKEHKFQEEKAHEDPSFAKKPAEIQAKMIEGRMRKFKEEICLLSQAFVMEPDQTVEQFLAAHKVTVEKFIRVEVGEGIEKKEEDFAAEVAKITGAN